MICLRSTKYSHYLRESAVTNNTNAKMSDPTYRKICVTPEKFGSRDFATATSIVDVKLPPIPPGARLPFTDVQTLPLTVTVLRRRTSVTVGGVSLYPMIFLV